MSKFRNPPFWSPNTLIALILRASKTLGIASPMIRNILMRGMSHDKSAKVFAGYTPTEHDVFVATFPKSGTNWTMQIAQQISWYGDAQFEHIHDVAAWPESPFAGIVPLRDPQPWQRSPTSKRVIKAAIRSEFIPYSEKAAYITVLRDPKEIFVSSYHFLFGIFDLYDYITLDQWYEMFVGGKFPGGSWAAHATGFWNWRDRPNVAVLSFPEMKKDLPGAVRTIAKTMGVALNDAQLDAVVKRSSFSYMKEHESMFAPPRFLFTRGQGQMLRSGKAGGTHALLSKEQQAGIDRFCMGELEAMGSDVPYEELFEVVRV